MGAQAKDWEGRESEYTYFFTPEDIAELAAAVGALKGRGISTEDDIIPLTKDDYALPNLAPKLVGLAKEVTLGRGFQLLKGFPVDQYKGDRVGLVLAYWGVALHLGRPLVSQTDHDYEGSANGGTYGSVLNHITVGRHARPAGTKAHAVDTIRLVFHSDQGATDLISLLSLTNAKEGGVSKWVSSIAIHNELLRRGRKDLVEVLSKPWYVGRKLDQARFERDEAGNLIKEATIPFEYHDGYLSVYYQSNNYQEVEKELSPLQEEALWAVAALAEDPEFHFAQVLEPGTIEWIHNPSIMHSRSEVVDGEASDEKRHLLRFWVDTDANTRPIAPTFAPRSSVQAQGGFKVPEGSKLRLPLHPPSRPDA
ncbi:Clavaminate synthase-like protein [Coccomyxa subellipsoidea C-169]|uniref:Clavaminate synthase-like protein n=1 Tax=Coccomyxa subellipsoidea (strain C-169) TaxID=574566 RepID=I0Z2P1_COCSC|nr:Clavaminate synthase-like protein [Coccomyxa subellipsoidea C-169]EIE24910.1 Clavaminate synthase-like protein [Coccomyxa subellipsoidea C-169]|eukprot:XP_005649454.1 Clavaminate synthase-like protein [Coccomyxa subellipsoidea C-169]